MRRSPALALNHHGNVRRYCYSETPHQNFPLAQAGIADLSTDRIGAPAVKTSSAPSQVAAERVASLAGRGSYCCGSHLLVYSLVFQILVLRDFLRPNEVCPESRIERLAQL